MKLWLLEATASIDYDCYDAFVVRAQSETAARELAQQSGGGEIGMAHVVSFWTDPAKSTCVALLPEGEVKVIIGSFNAG